MRHYFNDKLTGLISHGKIFPAVPDGYAEDFPKLVWLTSTASLAGRPVEVKEPLTRVIYVHPQFLDYIRELEDKGVKAGTLHWTPYALRLED